VAGLRRGSVAGVTGPDTARDHWERIYADKRPAEVSWYEAVPRASLAAIESVELSLDAPILDIGGGSSRLASELLRRGHTDITVADISANALERAREGFADADRVDWVVADVRDHYFGRRFAVWHDRAVFHFMVSQEDRDGYLATLERSLQLEGHAVIATFGPQGPTRCSGLPVQRYGPEELVAALGDRFQLLSCHLEEHRTPRGETQQYLYSQLAAL
jgi:ubiquinone/menaquinone biosynthesis C-methylase UbiE